MPLTDTAIRNAKPVGKPLRLFDGGGLYLEVAPAVGKWWRLKYRFGGKEKRISVGVYPDVPLAAARKKRDESTRVGRRKWASAALLAASNSIEAVALGWMDERRALVEPAQYEKTMARFKNDVFPWIGKRPIAEIDAPELLTLLKRIDARGARDTAHRVRAELNRTKFIKERRAMMQQWANYLDQFKAGADVIPMTAMQ